MTLIFHADGETYMVSDVSAGNTREVARLVLAGNRHRLTVSDSDLELLLKMKAENESLQDYLAKQCRGRVIGGVSGDEAPIHEDEEVQP